MGQGEVKTGKKNPDVYSDWSVDFPRSEASARHIAPLEKMKHGRRHVRQTGKKHTIHPSEGRDGFTDYS